MGSVALILVLMWLALVLLLWFGSAWFQDFLYSEPSPQLYWRAPVAGLFLVGWAGFWCHLDFQRPGRYPALYDFSASERRNFDEVWAVRDGAKVHYKRSSAAKASLGGRVEFRETAVPYRTWQRSDAVIVQENGAEVRFEAERDKNNNFKVATGGELRYLDPKGRAMTEGSLGQLYTFRWGTFAVYAFLNLVLLVLWFASLWLLIRFQWSHALGLAVVFWLMSILLIVPMLLAKAEEAGHARAATGSAAGL